MTSKRLRNSGGVYRGYMKAAQLALIKWNEYLNYSDLTSYDTNNNVFNRNRYTLLSVLKHFSVGTLTQTYIDTLS